MKPAPAHDLANLVRRAQQAMVAGDLAAAGALYEAALQQRPREARLLYALGVVEARRGRMALARKHLSRAVQADPGLIEAWCDLAVAHRAEDDLPEALRILNRALARAPGHPHVLANLVEVHQLTGDFAEVRRLLGPLLESGAPLHPRLALAFGKAAPGMGMSERAIVALDASLADQSLPGEGRMLLLFQRAAMLDRARRFDDAWRDASEANALKGASWSPEAHARSMDRMIENWMPGALPPAPSGSGPGAPQAPRPVLIVGPPRSGTSLVEQILASHPRVAAGGEMGALHDIARDLCAMTGAGGAIGRMGPWHLTDPRRLTPEALAQAGERYRGALAGARRAGRTGADVVTDKMPDNFLHLGLVASAAPDARVLVCRRDERDIAVSCFFLNFRGPYDWSCSVEHIWRYLRDAQRLIDHWRRTLATLPILDVAYEDLVTDLDAHARRIIDFAGLPWDERCARPWEAQHVALTSSNDQVRRPVYTTSVGRWRNYERWLTPPAPPGGE